MLSLFILLGATYAVYTALFFYPFNRGMPAQFPCQIASIPDALRLVVSLLLDLPAYLPLLFSFAACCHAAMPP